MVANLLARLMAVVPTGAKYRLARLRPLYTWALAQGGNTVRLQLQPGTLNWQIDRLTSQRHLLGSYEPHMQAALAKWVRPGDTVYDIGAHAGFHSLYAALLVGNKGRVIAFEPHPGNRASLQRQAALNPSLAVSVLAYALSDQTAQLAMSVTGDSSQASIAHDGELQVEARRLDDLLSQGVVPPPDLLKIDVEGHEAAVLQGARATLSSYRPVILCDYNDHNTLEIVTQALLGLEYEVAPGPPVSAVPRERV